MTPGADPRPPERWRAILFALLVAMVFAIGLLHSFTPGHDLFLHGFYRRLAYFPIVLGGLLFGLAGGLLLAVLASLAYIPHLLHYLGGPVESYRSELLEVLLYLSAGALVGFIAGREARLRARFQDQSRKLQRTLDRVSRQGRQLLEAEQRLAASQRFAALGQLAASLAHELKNPLATIRGIGEILRDELGPDHPRREFADILVSEVDRLDRTVHNVLDLARSPQGEAAEDTGDLAEVVERVVQLVQHHVDKKGVRLTVDGVAAGAGLACHADQMVQVFLNVLLNAVDMLEAGGRIWLTVTADEQTVTVRVEDDGPGVPAQRREEIFQPFVTTKEGGTGLGLSISRRIVESHGGRLECDASEHGGACFRVVLPRRRPSEVEQFMMQS